MSSIVFLSEFKRMAKCIKICSSIFSDMVSHWVHAFPDQDSLSWLLAGLALFYFRAARSGA